MTQPYRIVEATQEHVRLLGPNLRREDEQEALAAGVTAKRAVWRSFKASSIRRTAFIGEDIAAMWGVTGILLGNVGNPWLLTTDAIEKLPLAFFKEARCQVRDMLAAHPILFNYVPESYTRAVRFLALLGFTIDAPAPFGPNRASFHRFHMER